MLWSAFLLLGCFCLTFGNSQFPDYCRSCNLEECLPVNNCIAGKTKDVCGCCEVCAKAEFELCDHPSLPHPKIGGSFGKCGQDLECKIRTDLGPGDVVEAICYCRLEDEVCGSNGKTYDNVCKMKEAAILSNSDITQTKRGPCNSVPIIASLPENVKNVTGSNIAILCEARGYPIPDITWVFTRVDGKVFSLPSDDLHMSLNTRGGPEKWQVTGWLQIIDLKKEHEGDYTCTASNNDGSVKATARVNVVNKEDKSKY